MEFSCPPRKTEESRDRIELFSRQGEILHSEIKSNKLRVQWIIPDFISLIKTAPSRRGIESPEFPFRGSSWRLDFQVHVRQYSTDLVLNVYAGTAVIFLRKKLTCVAYILKGDGVMESLPTHIKDCIFSHEAGSFSLCDFQKRISELAPSGTLTFICIVEVDSEVMTQSSQTSDLLGTYRLTQDFNKLLLSGDASDATIRVRGHDFRVHKLILLARSPALAAMFSSNASEVNLEDWQPDTFRRFLHYVYTGGLEDLTPDNATDLYELANEYEMEGLQKECLESIKKGLSVETFCRVVAIAVKHSELELIQLTTDLFAENIGKIIQKGEWQDFLCEHPIHANELLVRAHRGARK